MRLATMLLLCVLTVPALAFPVRRADFLFSACGFGEWFGEFLMHVERREFLTWDIADTHYTFIVADEQVPVTPYAWPSAFASYAGRDDLCPRFEDYKI